MKIQLNNILNDIKCCIRNSTPVEFLSHSGYKPIFLSLRFQYEWVYEVHLEDPKRPDVKIKCPVTDIQCPHFEQTEETLPIPKLAAFAMKRKVPIDCGENGIRICAEIQMHYKNNSWHLIAELHDINKINPVIYEFVNSINWPSSGGGYICTK